MAPVTRQASKKIKYTDDGELPDGHEPAPAEAPTAESEESDSDSDSDEAPEEESISASKAKTLNQQKEQKRLEQERRKQEKQKRKEQDLVYQQQQQEKKKRLDELMASKELPDLLPDELLQAVEKTPQEPQGKHMRSEDLEEEYAEMRKKAKLEKLKQLKQQRTLAIKKGPVHVQVQQFGQSKKIVPRADPKVVESKNSWLNRDSLRRK